MNQPIDSAFPVPPRGLTSGLSKREYIATCALQGILACRNGNLPLPIRVAAQNVAREAVEYADALIAELQK
jgi:hypothetical protein